MQNFPVHARAALAHAAQAQLMLEDVSKLSPHCTDTAHHDIQRTMQIAGARFDAALDKALDMVPDDQIEAALRFLQERIDVLAQHQAHVARRGVRIQVNMKAQRERKEQDDLRRRAAQKKHLILV